MSFFRWLFSWIGFKCSSEQFALILVGDDSGDRHYRWLNLKDFRKALKKNNISVRREFPPEILKNVNGISWMKECPVIGCSYNVFKIYLKTSGFCHLRSKMSLGEIIRKCQQQVFANDSTVKWHNVKTIKFVPVGSALYYDSRMYTLNETEKGLSVQRFYPDTEVC